jgi:DNA-binding MarR family transcriptional regulator/GNAT superfamily N-acetyltransferase
MDRAMVAQVRRFNRTVTQRIGVLHDEFLARERPLGQARLLWEVGPDGVDVRDLRARLDLDSGYVSRLLRSLEAAGLISVRQQGRDARVRTVRLTAAGRAECRVLDDRSDEAATELLRPLSDAQRARLVAAMAEVERLFIASAVQVQPAAPRHPYVRYCLDEYFAELARRFEGGFQRATTLPVDDGEVTPPAGVFLVATLHEEPVGCGAVKMEDGGYALLKRMWVSPAVRGLGLGRRLLTELEGFSRDHGAHTVRLDTNRALGEAIRMYREAGYREVPAFTNEPYAHYWFAKRMR